MNASKAALLSQNTDTMVRAQGLLSFKRSQSQTRQNVPVARGMEPTITVLQNQEMVKKVGMCFQKPEMTSLNVLSTTHKIYILLP